MIPPLITVMLQRLDVLATNLSGRSKLIDEKELQVEVDPALFGKTQDDSSGRPDMTKGTLGHPWM